MTYENALEVLKKYGQEHVLAYYDELNDEEKQSFPRLKRLTSLYLMY